MQPMDMVMKNVHPVMNEALAPFAPKPEASEGPFTSEYASARGEPYIAVYDAQDGQIARLPLPPVDMGRSTDPERKARQEANAALFVAAGDLRQFVATVARMTQDGETIDGQLFDADADDAIVAMDQLITKARQLLPEIGAEMEARGRS